MIDNQCPTPDNDDHSTALILVESSLHGRERRSQRAIVKRDLQAAVKYGQRTGGHFSIVLIMLSKLIVLTCRGLSTSPNWRS